MQFSTLIASHAPYDKIIRNAAVCIKIKMKRRLQCSFNFSYKSKVGTWDNTQFNPTTCSYHIGCQTFYKFWSHSRAIIIKLRQSKNGLKKYMKILDNQINEPKIANLQKKGWAAQTTNHICFCSNYFKIWYYWPTWQK